MILWVEIPGAQTQSRSNGEWIQYVKCSRTNNTHEALAQKIKNYTYACRQRLQLTTADNTNTSAFSKATHIHTHTQHSDVHIQFHCCHNDGTQPPRQQSERDHRERGKKNTHTQTPVCQSNSPSRLAPIKTNIKSFRRVVDRCRRLSSIWIRTECQLAVRYAAIGETLR